MHERGRDPAIVVTVGRERAQLLEVLDEDRRGRADVVSHVDEARARRGMRTVVVDDGERLDLIDADHLRVDIVRVDEADEVRRLGEVVHVLQLLHLDVEKLDERAVLAMAELVAVADGRLRDAEPLRDVGLCQRGRDPVGIRMPAEGDEQMLPLGSAKRFREAAGSFCAIVVRQRQPTDRLVHGSSRIQVKLGPGGDVWTHLRLG